MMHQSLALSELPVWDGGGVQPQQAVLRVYVVATQDGYVVMPGGLARVSAGTNKPLIAMPDDSGSKVAWVLAASPIDTSSLTSVADQPILLRRSGYDFPSRAADNLFWMGRYAERAEGLVRFLRSLLVRLVDDSRPRTHQVLPTLIQAMVKTWGGLPDLASTGRDMGVTGYRHVLVPAILDPTLSKSVLRQTLVTVRPQEAGVLEALLEFGDSSITYRSRYLTRLQCAPVLDLLLADDTNPRALLYQLIALAEHVDNLPRNDAMPWLSPAQRLAVTMLTDVRLAEIDALCQIGRNGTRSERDALLGRVLTHLPELSDLITYHYHNLCVFILGVRLPQCPASDAARLPAPTVFVLRSFDLSGANCRESRDGLFWQPSHVFYPTRAARCADYDGK